MQVFSALAISFMLFAISFLDQSARTTSTASVLLSGEETAALRELRTSLVRSHLKPPSSWVVEESDCCSWEGVECRSSNEISTAAATTHSSSASTSITNNTSSRMVVEGLLLSNVSGHNYEKPWYTLNLGVFKAFQQLRQLDLSLNNINGSLESLEISGMRKLQHLNLSGNYFSGTIPKTWAALSSLIYLDLSFNNLRGPLDGEVLTSFKGLIHLDLARNTLIGPLPTNDAVASLNKLEYLDLSYNGFEGGIPESWVTLTALTYLDLSGNRLNGSLPNQVLTSFSELGQLDLGNNSFTGPLPLQDTATGLKKLQYLDLSFNGFEGGIPESWADLTSLVDLNLRNNRLNGSLPNQVVTSFSELRALDLSHNSFTGPLPLQVLTSLLELEYLDLKNNSFTGPLPLQVIAANLNKLLHLDLSYNSFERGMHEF